MPRGPLEERCRLTNKPMYHLDPLGPDWVDDNGLRADRVPAGTVAMGAGSLSAGAGYRNQTEGLAAIRADPRWHGYELVMTISGDVVRIQHGIQGVPPGSTPLG